MNHRKFSRREFLRSMMILGIGVRLLPRAVAAQSGRIIVIGAGASGLAAAYSLMDEGYEVLVLEARNRVGGRAWSDNTLAPYPIELGAEFVHGSEVVTWDMLEEFEQDSLDEDEGEGYIYFEGELWTEAELADEYDFDGDIETLVETLVEEWIEEDNDDASLKDLLDAYQDEYEDLADPEVRRLLDNKTANENAANNDDLSIYSIVNSAGIEDGSGDYWLEEGYSALMNAIADELDIRLDTSVIKIEWNASGASVTTGIGETLTADKVIVTLPLGVLKAGVVEFSPALPAGKQDAIRRLGAGHVDKLILKFDTVFWDEEMVSVDTTLDTQIWWRPGYGRDDELPILTALIGGRMAERFETMSEAEVIAAGLRDLEQMFEVENLADHLVEGKFIAWGSDPYARMGYSYLPVGGDGLNDTLAEPIDDVLFFAGEATNADQFATVHGAFESGFRAADEVMEALDV